MAEHKCKDPNCKHDEKEIEQKYVMLQMIDAQMKELEKEIENIEQRAMDISSLKMSLKSFAGAKSNSKSLSPLGLGIYTESEVKSTKDVFVNVGAGVMVKKTTAEAGEMLDKQMLQIDSVALQLTQNITNLATRAQQIEKEIQALMPADKNV